VLAGRSVAAGRSTRAGAAPMPVAVELNGLLPGLGPGRGPRWAGAPGRGAAAPGRGALVPGCAAPAAAGVPACGTLGPPACGPAGRWAPGRGAAGLEPGARVPGATAEPPWPATAGRGPDAGEPAEAGPAGAVGAAGAAGADVDAATEGTGVTGRGPGRGPGRAPPAAGAEAPGRPAPGSGADGADEGAAEPPPDWPAGRLSPGPPAGPRLPGAAVTGPGRGAAARSPPPPPPPPDGLADPALNVFLSLRTTGASIVEDADRTNSPIFSSSAMTALLSTPNSFASS
jgi:hypothetical protein